MGQQKVILGQICCKEAVSQWYGVSPDTLRAWIKRKTLVDGRRTRVHQTTSKTNYALEWLTLYLERYAEYLPCKEQRFLGRMHTQKFMYEGYSHSVTELSTMQPISFRHFETILHKYFPDVTKYKWTPFTKCTMCVTVKDIKSRGPGKRVADMVNLARQEHLDHVE